MTDDNLTFGPATEAEYKVEMTAALVHRQSWMACYGSFVPPEILTKDNTRNAFDFKAGHLELLEEGYKMWLARSAGALVGVAIFGADPSDRSRGKIDSLYVHPDFWGKRVGTQFLDAILDVLDYKEIVLDCAAKNERGRGFWKRCGFEEAGPAEPYPIDGYGELVTVRYVLKRPAEIEPPSNPSTTD